MSLNIKSKEVVRLACEIVGITGESKTEAIRISLLERRARLKVPTCEERERAFAAVLTDVHARLSPEAKKPWTRDDYDRLFD